MNVGERWVSLSQVYRRVCKTSKYGCRLVVGLNMEIWLCGIAGMIRRERVAEMIGMRPF